MSKKPLPILAALAGATMVCGTHVATGAESTSSNAASFAPTYTTIDPPGSTSTNISAISDMGVAAGAYIDGSGVTHGFIYSNGGYTTIDPPGSVSTNVASINASGVAAGSYIDGSAVTHGFIYSNGGYTTIDPPGSISTMVASINNAGAVVGTFDFSNGYEGFLFDGNSYTIINVFPNPGFETETNAISINNSGQILGQFFDWFPLEFEVGFIYTNGQIALFSAPNNSINGIFPSAMDGYGNAVGPYFASDFSQHGFIFYSSPNPSGQVSTLDFPGAVYTHPTAINNFSEIAGVYGNPDGSSHGFFYQNHTFTTIDPPGSTSTSVSSINSSGKVAGTYTDGSGVTHGLVVTTLPFVGVPGGPYCSTRSVRTLDQQYDGLYKAAKALGYSSVSDLVNTISVYCGS